jgi:hypothetical protein
MPWKGPFRFRDYLDRPGGVPDVDLPPEVPGNYLLTGRRWSGQPSQSADPLWGR